MILLISNCLVLCETGISIVRRSFPAGEMMQNIYKQLFKGYFNSHGNLYRIFTRMAIEFSLKNTIPVFFTEIHPQIKLPHNREYLEGCSFFIFLFFLHTMTERYPSSAFSSYSSSATPTKSGTIPTPQSYVLVEHNYLRYLEYHFQNSETRIGELEHLVSHVRTEYLEREIIRLKTLANQKVEEMQKEVDSLRNIFACKICKKKPWLYISIPCGHPLRLCKDCLPSNCDVTKLYCPCNLPVDSIQQVLYTR